MSEGTWDVPQGSGTHPIALVVIAAPDAASKRFYADLFGWGMQDVSADVTAAATPAGPAASLRANPPEGFPGVVPFVSVRDVEAALAGIVAAGGSVDAPPWRMPPVGTLARFKDPSGTVYGLTDAVPAAAPRLPPPFGAAPKPPAGTICSVEMYAADGAAAARFFGDAFGWGARETMPQYVGFDPGAGVGGVFQSHTPDLRGVAYIYVDDVAATLTRIEAAGGSRMGDPMSMPGMGTFGYFGDPSGTTMGLIGP